MEIGTGVEDVMGSQNRICVLDGGHGMVLASGGGENSIDGSIGWPTS